LEQLSCHRCNAYKSDRTLVADPETVNKPRSSVRAPIAGVIISDGARMALVIGLTACGRATVEASRLNNEHVSVAHACQVMPAGIPLPIERVWHS
jgi:hypothetical protein